MLDFETLDILVKPPVDLAGQRFGRLLVLQRHSPDAWSCKCDCGNTKVVKTSNLSNGGTKSCGCLAKESRKASGLRLASVNKELHRGRPRLDLSEEQRAARFKRDMLHGYKGRAREKGLEWKLTEEQFETLLSGNCHYCNEPPAPRHRKIGTLTCNGIDRKDNLLGYNSENVVSCCWSCNRIKRCIPYGPFIDFVNRIKRNFATH